VWAPFAERVELVVGERRSALLRIDDGWWTGPELAAGTDYAFSVDGGEPRPDPRSRWQPHGVHGPSRVVDASAYAWRDAAWHGRPILGGVVYELHIGTFTPEGTFDAAIARLDHLVDLGVAAIEVLPIAAFSGRHGWGYDGVALYAVHDPYGGPDGFRRFVDAAHQRGLAVIVDAVYNHLGPSGNYLRDFGPYFTDTHHTPWGDAVNYDAANSDEVRRLVLDNATMWLRDYHCDGLRLDAVHAIKDDSAVHLLEQLASTVDALSAQLGRPLTLIAESDLNDPRLIRSREAGGYGLHAQWSDDFHHALHAALTGETAGYYTDFGPLSAVADTLHHSWFFGGRWSSFRGRTHGRPYPLEQSPRQLLGYLQTHDQVGNRARGERSAALMPDGLLRVGAALVLTSPYTPMLFMGEEWGASTPWLYFTDHDDPDLAASVRDGRRTEFKEFGWRPEDVPDPQDPRTLEASRLDWAELDKQPHRALLDWHRALIALRRQEPDLITGATSVSYDEDARWLVVRRGSLAVACNLATAEQTLPLPGGTESVLLASADAPEPTGPEPTGPGLRLAPESVAVVRLSVG
jgi:maltooligosyltrehalose trehalohydrolase